MDVVVKPKLTSIYLLHRARMSQPLLKSRVGVEVRVDVEVRVGVEVMIGVGVWVGLILLTWTNPAPTTPSRTYDVPIPTYVGLVFDLVLMLELELV